MNRYLIPRYWSGAFSFITMLFCLTLATSARSQTSRELLLESNEIQRRAHMENDAALLVSQIADSMLSIQKGEISTVSNAQIQARFENYFKSVKYTKWDDLQEPIIQVSDDGKWAVMFVKKFLDLQYRDKDGNLGDHHFAQYAWESQYRKINGVWKITSITSTDKALTAEEAAKLM